MPPAPGLAPSSGQGPTHGTKQELEKIGKVVVELKELMDGLHEELKHGVVVDPDPLIRSKLAELAEKVPVREMGDLETGDTEILQNSNV